MNIFNQTLYEELCADILSRTQRYGATSAEVSINIEAGFSVSSRLGQIETVVHNQDKGLGITVYVGNQTGSVSSSDFSMLATETAIEKACSIAKYASFDPYAGLADKSLLAFEYPELNLDHPWEINTGDALALAIECENLAMQDSRITNSEGASVNSHRSLHVYGNSHGFLGSYLTTQHSMNCVLIAQEAGQMHRDYAYTIAREAKELNSIQNLAAEASQRTVSRLGARRLKTRAAPVIFTAELARSLIGNFVAAISGGNIYRKSSFLLDHLGKTVFPKFISLEQRPHINKAIGSTPFDNEGVKTLNQAFVKEGVLQNYILSSYSARKLGMTSTGNAGGVFNLILNSSHLTLQDLLKKMGTGLLVSELIGQGINLVTGNYSRGAFGYWVEGGEIQYPVQEITIAGNLRDMFLNIIDIANDIDSRGRIHTGSILIDNMMIAGE